MHPLVTLQDVTVNLNGTILLDNIRLSIGEAEQWAVIGPSGSGKTILAHTICGKVFYKGSIKFHFPESPTGEHRIMLVEQQHRFKTLANTADFYYQQRFNSADADDSITVSHALESFTSAQDATAFEKWANLLHLTPLLKKPLIQLSNGENKRLQLAEALLAGPEMIVLDNPFTGLDIEGRQTLHKVIDSISASGIHVLLITSDAELPVSTTHIAKLDKGRLAWSGKKQEYRQSLAGTKPKPVLSREDILGKLTIPGNRDFDIAIKMKQISVQYGNKKILDNINWEVKRGEYWSIAGPNGAGKSTLLSLITADNPQAYANEIYLFDKRRGRGESIWDIKSRIGYVSPELHLFFERTATCWETIASGLFDTIGLFRQLAVDQKEKVNLWIELLELEPLSYKPLFQLSLGQQRLVLLARALVKNPPLLILDEPAQGLDEEQSYRFRHLVNQVCVQFGSTLLYVSHYEKDLPGCVTKYLRLGNGKVV
jgi:molybdate transport system ATP-binding protein